MKKPKTNPAATESRRRRWRHYSFLGSAKNMQGQLENMLISDTITDETRELTEELLPKLISLQKLLLERKP